MWLRVGPGGVVINRSSSGHTLLPVAAGCDGPPRTRKFPEKHMSRHFVPRHCAATLAVLLALTPALASAQSDELARRLIELRGEVEQLNGELELLREEQRTTLAGLSAQRAELSASLERQQLAARELREKRAAAERAQAETGLEGEALKPLLVAKVADLRARIADGVPFKIDERLGELDQFVVQIENGTVPPQRAVNRLWAFYEDEFRLTRENSLHRQTITVDGWKMLADVAKLGTVALYFKTSDGQVGQAVRDAGQWRWQRVNAADDVARIDTLFDALRKQIRQGYFELPLLAVGAGQ
jgi:cell wall-associated NlpC family hydrolase